MVNENVTIPITDVTFDEVAELRKRVEKLETILIRFFAISEKRGGTWWQDVRAAIADTEMDEREAKSVKTLTAMLNAPEDEDD